MMKKVLRLAVVCFLAAFMSCSEDDETLAPDVDVAAQELAADLSEYEGTSFGSFKGVFSTNDSQDRGTIAIEIISEEFAKAKLTLVERLVINTDTESETDIDGLETEVEKSVSTNETIIDFQGVPTRTAEGDLTVEFFGNNSSFAFVVAQDGSNPTINGAVLNDNPSLITTVKENTRGAVLANTGVWSGTGSGGTAISDTFSLIFATQADADGDTTSITTMIMFNGTDIGTTMGNEQSACDGAADQTCDIMGTANLGPAAIDWTGTHSALGAPGMETCSEFNGTWMGPGGSSGSFISDALCAPPVNDLCAGALPIACDDSIVGSIDGATATDNPTDNCGTTPGTGGGVWYVFTSSGGGDDVTVSTCNNAQFDTKLNVYADGCGTLTCVGGNDDGAGCADFTSEFTFNEGTVAGTEFHILLSGFGTAVGTYTLSVTCAPPPPVVPNDTIGGAIPLAVSPAGTGCDTPTFTLDFTAASGFETTDSGLDGTCNNASTGLDQFFTWTATSESLLYDSQGPGSPGIIIRDMDGIEIDCIGTTTDGILDGWVMGQNLIIQIYDFGTSVSSGVSFCLEEFTPASAPANDTLAGAIPITPSAEGTGCATPGFTLDFTLTSGTTDSGLDGTCNNASTGLDQFFSWTATSEELLFSSENPGSPGIVIRDMDGVEIDCLGTFGSGVLSGWTIGQNLIIQIYDFGTSVSQVAFCLEEMTPPPPPPAGACDYTLEFLDSFGDGWNGGTINVLRNGVVVLFDVTLDDGDSGTITFPVDTGDEITTEFTAPGSFPGEITYNILDTTGAIVGSGDPDTDITVAIIADCL